MSQVAISGNASGTGTLTISAPNTNSNRTLTLPDSTGTLIAGTNGITAESNGGTGTTTGYYGFKNRIINGAMVIDQRNAGAAVTVNTASNQYSVDRWKVEAQATDGVFTAQQNSSVPTGFNNSLKITVTTADASIGSTQRYQVIQVLEGYNVADLGFGAADAKTTTLSFWVRSSLTGTFGGSYRNSAGNRSYPFSYTISVADTWEYKSVTIAGDTSGTWLKDSGSGIILTFSMGSGTSFQGTAGAWNGNNNNTITGETQLIGTLNATWYITGVQLEKGSTATSFDYRPYGTELALCQRYYFKIVGSTFPNASFGSGKFTSSTAASIYAAHPVAMRDLPTWSYGGTVVAEGTSGFSISAIAAQYPSYYATRLALTVSGATAGQGAIAQISPTSSDYVQATAEL